MPRRLGMPVPAPETTMWLRLTWRRVVNERRCCAQKREQTGPRASGVHRPRCRRLRVPRHRAVRHGHAEAAPGPTMLAFAAMQARAQLLRSHVHVGIMQAPSTTWAELRRSSWARY